MSDPELPSGWRIAQEFRYDGPPPVVDVEWVVYRWSVRWERRWFKKRRMIGWKRVYSNRFKDLAERWVWDTIKAMEATNE